MLMLLTVDLVGKEPGGERKKSKELGKRKQLGNESPLASMFQKQQTVNRVRKLK